MADEGQTKRLGSVVEETAIKKQEIDTNFGKVIAYIQGNQKIYIA